MIAASLLCLHLREKDSIAHDHKKVHVERIHGQHFGEIGIILEQPVNMLDKASLLLLGDRVGVRGAEILTSS